MKVVILSGGFGTRISEESHLIPKPMIEIGGKPILWHIMKYYSSFGYNDFIICLGYKQYVIKEFFAQYFLHMSDVSFDFTNQNEMLVHNNYSEPWKVTLIDTGLNTMTGGRLKRVKDYIGENKFFLTYGDGVSNLDLHKLLSFHNKHGKLATITSVQPGGRFGRLDIDELGRIISFKEKPTFDGGWINGGFMVLEPEVIDYINGDTTILEKEPFETLANDMELNAYKHSGFWQCMDTLRDKEILDKLWQDNKAPWKVW